MNQITKEEAVRIYESGLYKDWTDHEKCDFQLFQDRLAMPFCEFASALGRCIGRPIFTHEFGMDRGGLIKEYLGEKEPPSFEEIIALIPKDKVIFIETV